MAVFMAVVILLLASVAVVVVINTWSVMDLNASLVLFYKEATLLDDSPATFAISLLIELLALVTEALTSVSFR